MKILLINKFYYLSGGAERYVFEWEKNLRAHGDDTIIFSMHHPDNRPSDQERFFVDQISFDKALGPRTRLAAALHSIWSSEARRKLRALLESEGRPDIAHIHAFVYQLTPSTLGPLVEMGVPIVQSCHEYAHVCVNQRLYNQRTDEICEACIQQSVLSPLWKRCIKGSFTASATGCFAGLADRCFGRSRKHIRRFLTPSDFMRRKMIEGGMPAEGVFHVPHAVDSEMIAPAEGCGEYMLFFGRLVSQKGIRTFLKAAAMRPHIPCKILGSGALENEVRQFIRENNLAHVEVLGYRADKSLWDTVRDARAVIVPSEWHEPFGLVVLEAMAAARAVIASNAAGPAEILVHGDNGLLFPPGNAEILAEAMEQLWSDPERAIEMGRVGRRTTISDYAPELHYERLMKHFKEVIA